MDSVSPTLTNLIIFVLAINVGYHVLWTVTPALAAVKVFGGFLVTRRMFETFGKNVKKLTAPAAGEGR